MNCEDKISHYLKIKILHEGLGEKVIHFVNNYIDDDCCSRYNLLPSSVTPSASQIKNVERAIDGRAHIDISAVVREIAVRFDMLGNDELEYLKYHLNAEKIEMHPVIVEYFQFLGGNQERSVKCFLDSIGYTPFIYDDELKWRNVELTFVEICGSTKEGD